MSGIRKYKRKKQAIDAHKNAKKKMTRLDIWLNVGIAISFVCILLSLLFFSFYGGRPEGIINTTVGSFFVKKFEAGNNIFLDMTVLCAILAAIGLLISGISLTIKHIRKRSQIDN